MSSDPRVRSDRVERDHVDDILRQWNRERPDVDVSAMAVIGRISRLERLISARLDQVFKEHGLEAWEFDVLATLRRSGSPFELSAGQLLNAMMITSGTMTNRIDRLEHRGFVRRRKDPADGRVVLVGLTPAGRRRVDAALEAHAANELNIISSLSPRDRTELTRMLRRLHLALDTTHQNVPGMGVEPPPP
jgi:DNA-binding MarR family transcriptional regulator